MNRFLVTLALTLAAAPASALTPEQEMQVARMRLAGVCQRLVMDGLLRTCTVDALMGRPRKAVRP